jgi:hypothetical protein
MVISSSPLPQPTIKAAAVRATKELQMFLVFIEFSKKR